MGQGESQQINPDQVTGFDPDVDAATRPGRQRRRKNGSSVNPAVKPREVRTWCAYRHVVAEPNTVFNVVKKASLSVNYRLFVFFCGHLNSGGRSEFQIKSIWHSCQLDTHR